MDPERKRKIRLVVALGTAVVLATSLIYVSFSASSEAKSPAELVGIENGGSYQLEGRVKSIQRDTGESAEFVVEDPDDPSATIPVEYTGVKADAFREGREIVVTGSMVNGVFVGDRDSLLTKCPSKFSEEGEQDQNVIIED